MIHVALLRAVNVGGTGTLPMAELKRLCSEAGFENPRTYIASGNVVLASQLSPASVQARLEGALAASAGKPIKVLLRSAREMAEVLQANPFADAPGNRVLVSFLDRAPPEDLLAGVRGQTDEEIRLGRREVYVRYPSGMAASRLLIPAAAAGTARNLNTVAALVRMSAD